LESAEVFDGSNGEHDVTMQKRFGELEREGSARRTLHERRASVAGSDVCVVRVLVEDEHAGDVSYRIALRIHARRPVRIRRMRVAVRQM